MSTSPAAGSFQEVLLQEGSYSAHNKPIENRT